MLITLLTAATTLLSPLPARPAPMAADAAAVRVALDDPTIVAIYDAANTYDIEAGMLGEKKASNSDVHDYAAMLVKAHESARQQGRDLAKRLGVKPTPPAVNPLAADHVAAMKKLSALSGKEFDRAYLESEIAYHKAVISAVQNTLMPAIQNADLKALVVKVSPVFVQHQRAGELLLAKITK